MCQTQMQKYGQVKFARRNQWLDPERFFQISPEGKLKLLLQKSNHFNHKPTDECQQFLFFAYHKKFSFQNQVRVASKLLTKSLILFLMLSYREFRNKTKISGCDLVRQVKHGHAQGFPFPPILTCLASWKPWTVALTLIMTQPGA